MKIAAVPESLLERLLTVAGLTPTPLVDTFHAVIVARAVMVATRLGVFDAVTSAPQSVQDIAERLAVSEHALGKLLNVLVAIGYLKFFDNRYIATRLTQRWLRRDSARSLYDNILLRFLEWEAIEATEKFVRTGRRLDVHEQIHEDQWGVYQRGMHSLAKLSASEVARRVRLPTRARAMLDVGGGHGAYSAAFCRRHKLLQAVVLDLPHAVESAASILAEEKMGRRVTHRSGNALTADLGEGEWDLIFMSHLVHHFDEASNESLLRRAGRALRPDGVVAILDVLRPNSPNACGQTGALLDLYFAITSNSGTWSNEEITDWFKQAKLEPRAPISLRSVPGITVLTAIKARNEQRAAAPLYSSL
jgi:SAM-dependent methyltransferase